MSLISAGSISLDSTFKDELEILRTSRRGKPSGKTAWAAAGLHGVENYRNQIICLIGLTFFHQTTAQ